MNQTDVGTNAYSLSKTENMKKLQKKLQGYIKAKADSFESIGKEEKKD